MHAFQYLLLIGVLISVVCGQANKSPVHVSVTDVEIIVSDSSDAIDVRQGKKVKVEYPNKADNAIAAELFQHVFVDFKVKNKQSGSVVEAHQALLRVVNSQTQQDSFVVAQYDSAKGYSAHFLVKDLKDDFTFGKDSFDLELIIGDASIANPITWKLASNVNFKLNNSRLALDDPFKPKAAITHAFRQPEKRPPATISFAFTLAVLAPILILVVGWPLVGANMWNFPTGAAFINAVAFQATVGAIFALYFFYWVGLNMIQTLTYLAVLFVPLLFFGSKTLNYLATLSAAKKTHSE